MLFRSKGTGSSLRTQTHTNRRAGRAQANRRFRFSTVMKDQSRHCGVSAVGTDPNGCSPPEGISQGKFCTEKSFADDPRKDLAWNQKICGKKVTTSPIKDFGEGINQAAIVGEKVSLWIRVATHTHARTRPNHSLMSGAGLRAKRPTLFRQFSDRSACVALRASVRTAKRLTTPWTR